MRIFRIYLSISPPKKSPKAFTIFYLISFNTVDYSGCISIDIKYTFTVKCFFT